jgi:MFS family permease
LVGLYVRLKITETPAFREAMKKQERVAVPLFTVFRHHGRALVLGTVIAIATFLLFYLLTVFCLSWGTTRLGFTRDRFLVIQMIGVLFFAAAIPCSAVWADRFGRRPVLMLITIGIVAFGVTLGPLFSGGMVGASAAMIVGFALMGLTYGPLGTLLSELFPTAVRYTGSSLTFNLAGIFGASLAPYAATLLATRFGLASVGYYLAAAAMLTLFALWLSGETLHADEAAAEVAQRIPGRS